MTVNEKLAESLTAKTPDIIPFLPYLLQDLWELGSLPDDIAELIKTHVPINTDTRIIDLGCGKGAVSIRLAREFGCRVKGIDIIHDFIAYARKKAGEYHVDNFCVFETGDINASNESGHDIVIFGAMGTVLGEPSDMLEKLKHIIRPLGFIVIDDAYTHEPEPGYYTYEQWLNLFDTAGLTLIDKKDVNIKQIKHINSFNQGFITQRAGELKMSHPEWADMFDDYVQSQQEECNELESRLVGTTWLLQYK